MELAVSICLGIGLAAACGFRVFVPLLGISAAALADQLTLAEGFAWVDTWPAFACLLTATILEVAAYYIPWLDNVLDSIATPAAVIAGTVVMGSVVTDMSPLMKWSLALIAGGGAAGLIQAATVALRGGSSAVTGGTANWLVATTELLASLVATIVTIVLPLVGALLAVALAAMIGVAVWRLRTPRQATNSIAKAHDVKG
jgi:hypothetical protein